MRLARPDSPRRLPKLAVGLLLAGTLGLFAQRGIPAEADQAETHALFERVIANQKKVEESLDVYERLEYLEMRKNSHDPKPYAEKSYRVIPAGTGTGRIPVRRDGQPADPAVYRAEVQKLERQLAWAAESGRAQSEAYAKIQKKRKERDELISAANQATSRNTSLYSKVRGFIWVDEAAGQLARIQGETTEDISIGMFLARVNKGSYFMQERYEIFPGCWLPTFSQYDFDGRKLFMNFNIHERTFYTHYRYIGTPHEAFLAIQKELHHPDTAPAQSH
jgi:hypothetical protein